MKIKVLLVEDEPSLSMIIKDALENRDFIVKCAQNGHIGIELFYSFNPDVVVADIMMPKLDGFSMTKLIRQTSKDIPLLFLSAKSKAEDVIEGFEAGGNDYLKKPFGMEELIIRIKPLLNRIKPEVPKEKIYKIGKYTFDPVRQKLIHDKIEATLSHRESLILKKLCLNKNTVMENKPILLELWGDDNFFNVRSFTVFIVKLRKKLSLDQNVKIINIRGVGYKLIC
jgi:DNA-binding response OmpR family regulator